MPQYADIAIPVSVNKIFTYSIPKELEGFARIGVRVIVPFGRRQATGLIVGLPDTTTVRLLKPLRDVIDPGPVASDELLQLCRWIASYYLSPLGEVMKAAMPHAFDSSGKRLVRLKRLPDPDELSALKARSPRRAELLALLNQTAVIHLALEPANGLSIRVEAVPAIELAELYQGMTGYHLNP